MRTIKLLSKPMPKWCNKRALVWLAYICLASAGTIMLASMIDIAINGTASREALQGVRILISIGLADVAILSIMRYQERKALKCGK